MANKCAVTSTNSKGAINLYCVMIVWVVVATVSIHTEAHSTRIPSSVLFAMKEVRTIEDLLQLLEQRESEEKTTPAKHIPWSPRQEKDSWEDDVEDEDEDDDDDDDDEEDGAVGYPNNKKPDPGVLADMAEQMGLKFTSSKFSGRSTSRGFIQELSQALSRQSPQEFSLNDVAELPPCVPRESLITVPTDANEPNVIYWPSCVTAKRCGGCCSNELFDCQATRSEIVQRDVVKMEYNPKVSLSLQYGGIISKNITQDTNCSCQCKVKSQDCDPATQLYSNCQCKCREWVSCPPKKMWDPVRCRCTCIAPPSERTCSRLRQVWSDDSCSCRCRKDLEARCRAPHVFNHKRCKCERRSTRSTIYS